MCKSIFLAIVLIASIGCDAPEMIGTPNPLNLEVQVSGRPAIGQPLSLQVDQAGKQPGDENLHLALPEGYALLSQRQIESDGAEFVVEPGQQGLAELVIRADDRSTAENSVFVFLERPAGTKVQAPLELSATIDPIPQVGKSLHVHAWVKALVDSPGMTLAIRPAAGLSTSASASVTRDLLADETLELQAELLVERTGEFLVEIEALSKTSDDLYWGSTLTFYVQAGTNLGNTITEFSQEAIDADNELQSERTTPPAPAAEPSGLPKREGKVETVLVGESADTGRPAPSDPLPPTVVQRQISLNINDQTAPASQAKPDSLQDDSKLVPPDPASGASIPSTEFKQAGQVPDSESAADGVPGWHIMMSEGFEGAWPNGLWSSFDANGTGNGEYYWDDDDYLPYSGAWSAWPARGGANGLDPQSYYYPNNMDSRAVYGPFDLSECSEAELDFYIWIQSEQDYDWLNYYGSQDGSLYFGGGMSGDSQGWLYQTFDLDQFCGDPTVWIIFQFTSDGSIVDDGAFIDDVQLWQYIAPGPLEVHGYWQYRDQNMVIQPLPYARVEVYDYDSTGNDLLGTTHTNYQGYYTLTFTNNDFDESGGVDLFTVAYSTDDYSVNVRSGGAGNTLYSGGTPVTNDLANGSFDNGSWYLFGSGIQSMYIYDMIANDAWNYLLNNVGWNNNYNLQVQWSPTSVNGTYYNVNIYLLAGDGWDEDVILHEYGHFVMHKIYTTYPPTPNCNPHSWSVHSSLGCAWSEGWANFLQGAIQNHPNYIDTEDQSLNYSLEPPSPWADHQEDEGAVAAGLWDVYDSAAESFDTINNGINGAANNGIWNVVYNLDPINVNRFWEDWGTSGNGYCPQVWSVFDHVTIDYDLSGPAAPPDLHSTTHSTGSWSNAAGLTLAWNVPDDGCGSGVAGYSHEWSNSPSTDPDATVDQTGTGNSWSMVNGSWYYHLRALDNAGNAGSTSHAGPYLIDLNAPGNPTSLSTSSHIMGVWSADRTIDVSWSSASDVGGSGIAGYSIEWTASASTVPDTSIETSGNANTSPTLGDGNNWYLHIRTKDNAGNWNASAAHFGPFYIDGNPPSNPTITSSSHTTGAWSSDNTVDLNWPGASDGNGSGVSGYSILWDHSSSSLPDMIAETGSTSQTSSPLADGSDWYFHLRARDASGLWNAGAAHFGPLHIDTSQPNPPSIAQELGGASNNVWQKLVSDPNFTWSGATDASVPSRESGLSLDESASGIAGYYYYWGTDPAGTSSNYTGSAAYNPAALSGTQIRYLRVQSRDLAGNTSAWATLFTFKFDSEAPASSVVSVSALVPGQSYLVSWSGNDSGSGLATYDIQYRVGSGGAWTDWLSGISSISANFGPATPVVPALGETYYFRSRARDVLGNLEAYPAEADSFILVTANSLAFLPVVIR